MNKFLSTLQELYLSLRLSYLIWKMKRATANLRKANMINYRTTAQARFILNQMQENPDYMEAK